MEQSLDVLIARAAVARTEARAAQKAADEAERVLSEANTKSKATSDALVAEINRRVTALDPESS